MPTSPMDRVMSRKFNHPPPLKRRKVVIRIIKPEKLVFERCPTPNQCKTPNNSPVSG